MTLVRLGEEIASRRLKFTASDGTVTEVLVKIGKPQPKEDGIGFYCPFLISGIGWERVEYSAGLDAVQTLQLVMLMIGAKLEFYQRTLPGQITWEGDSSGGLGFPLQ